MLCRSNSLPGMLRSMSWHRTTVRQTLAKCGQNWPELRERCSIWVSCCINLYQHFCYKHFGHDLNALVGCSQSPSGLR